MPDEYKNLADEASQTPEGATGAPDTPESIKGLTPEQIAEKLTNANKAIAEATRRNQEAAELRRRIEADQEMLEKSRQEFMQQQENFYGQLTNWKPPTSTTQSQTPAPNWDSDPIAAGRFVQEELERVKRAREEDRKAFEEKYNSLENELKATQSETAYNEYYKEEIKPKYPSVSKADINLYFSERPSIKADGKTVLRAAEDIQKAKDAELEAHHQDYLKRKAAEAEKATLAGGGQAGSFEKVDKFLELSEGEQVEQLKRDALKIHKQLGI